MEGEGEREWVSEWSEKEKKKENTLNTHFSFPYNMKKLFSFR